MIIIQNFIENYPTDKLLLHLSKMSSIHSSNIYENIKNTVKSNDKIYFRNLYKFQKYIY